MNYQENNIINQRYRLIKSIGRGSFGEVWLAADQALGINVAIKIYIALDSRGLDEFKAEFKSVYNLHHPNLLRADYFDNVGNNPYLVMPYCPTSVGSMIGTFDESELWRFIEDVARGLAYLHENDIIHRDIKPDNILRDSQDNYVITDFGLSTKMRSTLRRASARQVDNTHNQSGTIGYMAPEMFSAKPQAVKATDIWALGAAIYEIATGEMPFCGQGGIMELHGAELPELPAKYSKELESIMVKCLSKEPWDRPTAKDIIDLIQLRGKNVQEEQQVHKNESTSIKKIKTWAYMTTFIAICFIISTFIINDKRSEFEYKSNQYYAEKSRLQTRLSNLTEVLEKFMKDTPIFVTNISVWNDGESDQNTIYAKNTTYIYHSADFLSIKDISDEKIYIKFIAPYGLSQGSGEWASPSGYSYTQIVTLSAYEEKNLSSQGWGNKTKGYWGAGTYKIEYWYKNKCIGSKTFTIK